MGKKTRGSSLETELKYGLDSGGYRRLLLALRAGPHREYRFTNYYFDDNAMSLRSARFGLRIRLVEGEAKAILTLKGPALKTKGPLSLKVRREYEARLPAAKALALAHGELPLLTLKNEPVAVLKRHFPATVLAAVGPLGSMRMERLKASLDEAHVLELDRFRISGKVFHELEVETTTPERTDALVRSLLADLGIPCLPESQSKLSRFLELRKRNLPKTKMPSRLSPGRHR